MNTTSHLTAADQGDDDSVDSDFDQLTADVTVTVTSGETTTDVDAGLLPNERPEGVR